MVGPGSWGRLGQPQHEVVALASPNQLAAQLAGSAPGLAYGNGRSYGDVCLNPGGRLWLSAGLDHFIDFDPANGRLLCEAGVLLRDIQQMSVPRGWMLPVTPGTQLITVGGAIANDVHGKNHHALGSFGDHVLAIELARTDGSVLRCAPQDHPGWFAATVGGLGLTGVIVRAELQLCPVAGPWFVTETAPYADIGEFFSLADAAEAHWEHTVSWIDCVGRNAGRGLFMRGNPSAAIGRPLPQGRKRRMPLVPPVSLVNQLSLPLFNMAYFNRHRWRTARSLVHYEAFNYPLDNLLDWNRMYGPRGFYQYQSAVPRVAAREAVAAMLQAIAKAGDGSFLAVLKTFGDRPAPGMLSFAREGVTLALDFPNRGARTLRLFDSLDAIVREAGGRIYMAKDARMPRDLFESGYPRLAEFLSYRDPGISSAMSRRLMGA